MRPVTALLALATFVQTRRCPKGATFNEDSDNCQYTIPSCFSDKDDAREICDMVEGQLKNGTVVFVSESRSERLHLRDNAARQQLWQRASAR